MLINSHKFFIPHLYLMPPVWAILI